MYPHLESFYASDVDGQPVVHEVEAGVVDGVVEGGPEGEGVAVGAEGVAAAEGSETGGGLEKEGFFQGCYFFAVRAEHALL